MDSSPTNILPIRGERRLTVFMFTDIVDYSRLTNADEVESLKNLNEHNAIVRSHIAGHGGKELRNIGDAFFIEFPSTFEAVNCAYEIQSALHTWNLGLAENSRFAIRIGIHVGEVIHTGTDAFGDDVNISARIEKFSEPGGIAITQQTFDQIEGRVSFDFKFSSKQQLKGIPRPIAIYKAQLPWLKRRSGPKSISLKLFSQTFKKRDWLNWTGRLAISALVMGIALSSVSKARRGFHDSLVTRSPYSSPPVDLSADWSINPAPEENPDHFVPTNSNEARNFPDQIHGAYELKKDFVPEFGLSTPAIVLGMIPDQHKVFLNGQYIGGSKTSGGVSYYTFDSSLLKTGKTNHLLVKAYTQGALYPGISIIPGIGAFLGELDQVYSKVTVDQISFFTPRIIYFAVTLIAFFACIAGFLFNPSSNKKYLYYGLYLCAGCTLLAHYMPVFTSFLDLSQDTKLKLYPLTLSSFILTSSYLHLRGKTSLENLNNFLALAFFACAAALIPEMEAPPSKIGMISDEIYLVSLLYTALTTGMILISARKATQAKTENSYEQLTHRLTVAVIGFFGALNFAFCYMAVKGSLLPQIPSAIKPELQQITASYPMLFSLTLLGVGLVDYVIKARALQKTKGMEELIQKISKTLSTAHALDEAVEQIQKGLCQIIQVDRSTLYLFAKIEGSGKLVAQSISHPDQIQNSVKKIVDVSGNQHDGILGYVMRTRAAILVRDIRTDGRFQGVHAVSATTNTYKSQSCMVFPLMLGGDFLGILTFADKKDGTAFSSEDFQIVQMLTKDISLLLGNFRLQNLLGELLQKSSSQRVA